MLLKKEWNNTVNYSEEIDFYGYILNIYFSKSTEIIKMNKGFVNKFIGDAVMGLFNAVVDDEDHMMKAVKSALEIKKGIAIINEKLKAKGLEPIEVGIGIDSGICSVGNFGSREKIEFTAVGVPVNVAARLESISNGEILITEKNYEKIKDKINVSFFGEFELKNIEGKVRVYNVLGFK